MATAAELLAAEVCDDILTVDLDTQTIIIPKNVTILGVESDDNVRTLHFQVPRHFCKTDLSEFTIRINYENAKGAGDLYDVKDAVVTDDLITFDWLVGRYAVTYKGNVEFNVCMRDVDDAGTVLREFNTTPATLPVLRGLETGEAIIEEHVDILEQWRADLFGTGDTVEQEIRNTGDEVMANIEGAVATYVAENADEFKGEPGTDGVSATHSWNGTVLTITSASGTSSADLKGAQGDPFTYEDFTEEQLEALTGPSGSSIQSIVRTSGTGAAGTTDTYTVTLTDGSTTTFQVYNGADGEGAGDMLKSVYDPQNKNTDIFAYVDDAVGAIAIPETPDLDNYALKTEIPSIEGLATETYVDNAVDNIEPGTPIVTATSTDGVTYTAAVDGMDSMIVGKEIMLIPNYTSTTVSPKLNVNSLGEYNIRCPLTTSNSTTASAALATFIVANKPIKVRWNGTFWVCDIFRVDANGFYGALAIENGGTGATTAEAARNNLGVYSIEEVDAAIQAAIGDALGGSY